MQDISFALLIFEFFGEVLVNLLKFLEFLNKIKENFRQVCIFFILQIIIIALRGLQEHEDETLRRAKFGV